MLTQIFNWLKNSILYVFIQVINIFRPAIPIDTYPIQTNASNNDNFHSNAEIESCTKEYRQPISNQIILPLAQASDYSTYSVCPYIANSGNNDDNSDDGWISDPDQLDPREALSSDDSTSPDRDLLSMTIQGFAKLPQNGIIEELHFNWSSYCRMPPDSISKIFLYLFNIQSDVYCFLLAYIDRMKFYKAGRHSPAKIGITKFDQWFEDNSHSYNLKLTRDYQLKALEIGVHCNVSIFDHMCRIFRINELCETDKCKIMADLLTSSHYKEAVVGITRFQLQRFFSVEELLPPLIATDQISLVQDYLTNNKNLQIEFLTLLDKLCSPDTNYPKLYSYYQSWGFIKSDTNNKLSQHQIRRLAGRLIKLYDLDSSRFVYFTTNRVSSYLSSLLYQYYRTTAYKQIHDKNWLDLVLASVVYSKDLQIQLVDELVTYQDLPLARYITDNFGLLNNLPIHIYETLSHVQRLPNFRYVSIFTLMTTNTQDYYPLHLPIERVIIIENSIQLLQCQLNLSQPGVIIGIDAEWRPPLCNFGILRLGFLQLATRDYIYLLDMVALAGAVSEEKKIAFVKCVFCSDTSIKLGFAIAGDFKMLARSWPCVARLLETHVRTFDLQEIYSSMNNSNNNNNNNNNNNDNNNKQYIENEVPQNSNLASPQNSDQIVSQNSILQKTSLSRVVFECFGKELDKSNQIADWEKRPLRMDMIVYAALDAYCLIEIYDLLIKQNNLNFKMIPIK